MGEEVQVYRWEGFRVQSHLDEAITRRLFEHVRDNKLLGRTRPPRKGFLRMATRMLWRREFEFEGRVYVVEGGGNELAFYEWVDAADLEEAAGAYRHCVVCGTGHPDSDLVEVPAGPICRPCYEAKFPACVRCGRRVELSEDEIPAEVPFVCADCREP